jgi:predicted secreted protein
MSPLSAAAIYFIIWWVCLFAVLPFGVKSQHETGDVTPGTEHGAPHRPMMLRKLLATTVLATIVFAGVYLYFGILDKSLDDLIP